MPPRSSDPRRGTRGGGTDASLDPTVTPLRGAGDRDGHSRSGIGDARRYSPRGRSLREADAQRGRGGDPFRPALQVVRGGADEPARRGGRGGADEPARRGGRGGADDQGRRGGRAPAPRTDADGRTTTVTAPRAVPVKRAAPAKKAPAKRVPAKKAAAKKAQRRPVRRPKRQVKLPDSRRRLRSATILIFVLFLAIAGRLVELQLIDAKGYAKTGLENRIQTIPLAAPRGTIYDRDKYVLAHSVEARFVSGDPVRVQDPEDQARKLAPLLGKPVSELLPKLRRHNLDDGRAVRFEYLARGVDLAVADKVKALNLPGIDTGADERRDVPGHDLAANLLGYTNYELTGVTGLEAGYDQKLRGVAGERTFEVGGGDVAAEIPGGYQTEKPAKPGSSLQLTIDRDLQFKVQYLLSQRMEKAKADFGSAVVLDVKTGEVLAQASYPPYDAAEPGRTPADRHGDANTEIAVDPGSVAKVIAIGGALQEGRVRPDTRIPVGPTIRKGDTTYRDTHPLPEGTKITLPGILAYSSNVGTIKIADLLGDKKLYEYQRKFGLGSATGEGLPGESAGLVQPPENWSGSSYGSIPIGNGISVTPLQMTAVYATVANGGVWVQPHLVKATIDADGKATPAPAPRTRRVLSDSTAAALRTMLEAVVTVDGATGRRAAVPGYRVAGKTGTGKRVVDGKYALGDVASFIGMAPADAPRYVIGVFAHSPGGEGGDVSAPAFADMMAFTLGQRHVPPTGTAPPAFTLTG